jgi:hypothetical protein
MVAAAALVPVAGLLATTAPVPSAAAPDDAQSRLATPVSLARPDDGWVFKGRNMKWSTAEAGNSPRCHATYPICVHWTNGGGDAPAPGDGNGDGIPNQVEETLAAAATSWDVIVNDLGFRAPLPDGRSRFDGGSTDFDIYLADTGDKNLAGYTSSDDPRLSDASDYKFRDVSAFMVVDNDFRAEQFKFGSAEDNMKVTVAHELFHASQFAYDHNEDRWLTEGTATWVEDEVFDGIDLNRRALSKSPIGIPTTALDFARNGHEYGSWLFFRYLSEQYGKDIIRRVWRLADDSAAQTSTDRMRTFSMRAVSRALAAQDRDIHQVFASFVHDNLRPADTYDEGSSYPKPYSFRYELDRQAGDSGWLGLPLDHLSSAYVTIVPGDDVRQTGKVLLRFDGPPRKFDPRFRVTVRFLAGASKDFTVALDRHGDGRLRVAFGRDGVAGVDVAMINTSTRMRDCFKHATPYSCSGTPKDDDRTYAIRARLP